MKKVTNSLLLALVAIIMLTGLDWNSSAGRDPNHVIIPKIDESLCGDPTYPFPPPPPPPPAQSSGFFSNEA